MYAHFGHLILSVLYKADIFHEAHFTGKKTDAEREKAVSQGCFILKPMCLYTLQ